MQLFILFIQIAVGFFAAVGVYFFFSRVIDRFSTAFSEDMHGKE